MQTAAEWPYVRWLGANLVLVINRISSLPGELASSERAHATTMTPARLREFAAGRTVARHALQLLRHSHRDGVPMGANGEPIWPVGTVGSISHTSTHAAALVARSENYASVGLDLDDGRLLGAAAAMDLMTDAEVAAVLAQGWTSDVAIAQNIVFLMKEALFKGQYPIIRRHDLEFNEIELRGADAQGVLGASCATEDAELQRLIAASRTFYQEIHGLRICWSLYLH